MMLAFLLPFLRLLLLIRDREMVVVLDVVLLLLLVSATLEAVTADVMVGISLMTTVEIGIGVRVILVGHVT